jgi:hypothetical protein
MLKNRTSLKFSQLILGGSLLAIMLALVACGTLQVQIEPELEGADSETVTSIPTPTQNEPLITTVVNPPVDLPDSDAEDSGNLIVETNEPVDPEISADATPKTSEEAIEVSPTYPLKVAYVKHDNVWLWTEDDGSISLTGMGDVGGVRLSSDGQWVVFWRGTNLWVINSDGTDERNLTTQRDFAGIEISDEMAPYVQSIVPNQVAWRPGTHELFFNTAPQLDGPGLFLNDDLWVVDVDSGQLSLVLPPGEGGNFYFSPDGRQLAVVTPGRIDLMDPDGGNRREGLSHTPVITYSEFAYYATPVWAADSSYFLAAIPPVDIMAGDHQPTSIWSKNVDERPARLVGNLTALSGLMAPPIFSPDLSHVAYLFGDGPATGPDSPPPDLAIAEIGPDGLGESMVYSQQVEYLAEWSPDGLRFIYTPAGFTVPIRHIGTLAGDPLAMGDGQSAIAQSNWVDENNILFLQKNGIAWDILLAQPGGQPRLVDSVEGPPPAIHFSGTPKDVTLQ